MYVGIDFSAKESTRDGFVGTYTIKGWEGKDIGRLYISSKEMHIEDGIACKLQVASPNLKRTFNLNNCIWRLLLANLAPGKTFEELSQFDREVTQKYSEFIAAMDWFYTGSYRVVPPSEYTTGEIDVVYASSPEEALKRDADHGTPPDMQEMYKVCSSFYAPPKRMVWLTPIQVQNHAEFKFPV